MKVNLHTHTTRCNHAVGADEEYVLAAIEAGYDILGFADHTPLPYDTDFYNCDKMRMEELEGYIQSVTSLKEKYKDQIKIVMGLECEAVERCFPYLAQLKEKMDYLLLGNHGDKEHEDFFGFIRTPDLLWHYLETAVKGMETGLYLYLAHPDLMFRSYPVLDRDAAQVSRELCKAAKRLNMPLEYNLMGVSKGSGPDRLGYPCRRFWEIAAEENCVAVVGVDAHNPDHLRNWSMEEAKQVLREWGLPVLDNPLDASDKGGMANADHAG